MPCAASRSRSRSTKLSRRRDSPYTVVGRSTNKAASFTSAKRSGTDRAASHPPAAECARITYDLTDIGNVRHVGRDVNRSSPWHQRWRLRCAKRACTDISGTRLIGHVLLGLLGFKVEAHAYPDDRVEAVCCLSRLKVAQFRTDLSSARTRKPRCSYRGRFQGTSAKVVSVIADRPVSTAQTRTRSRQCTPNSQALMIRPNADLFDVGIAVDPVNDDIAHRTILGVHRYAATPPNRVVGEFFECRWRIIGDAVHADPTELFPGEPLDHLQRRAVFTASSADNDHPQSIAGSPYPPQCRRYDSRRSGLWDSCSGTLGGAGRACRLVAHRASSGQDAASVRERHRREIAMAGIVKKGFGSADEVRTPNKTRMEVVDLGGIKAARMTLEPGWRWSECIKPIAGTDELSDAPRRDRRCGKYAHRSRRRNRTRPGGGRRVRDRTRTRCVGHE